jgi:cytochrome d ubiquinol oxidase subunit II
MLGALVLYALLGGADFGGGVWDLFARRPRAARQRAIIERAIAPVWEANHVWLIVAVVILFTGFPPGFAALGTALHVPLTLLLIGIVLRGTGFTFRHYDRAGESAQKRWGRVFAISSSAAPIFLGIIIGTVTAGRIRLDENFVPTAGFFRPWLGAFPIAIGFLTLALFTFLGAVYLTVEAAATDEALAEDFRLRAIVSGVLVGACALAAALTAGPATEGFQQRLFGSPWSWPLQIATGLCAIGAFATLILRRYRLARVLAASQVALILLGWGLAQRPYLIAPDLTLEAAAAPPRTLELLVGALAVGSLILIPSLYGLMRVFKREPAFAPLDEDDEH